MLANTDENFDDIDLNEIFNDFNEKPRESLPKNDFKKTSQDDLTEFTENDCTAPRQYRKQSTKSRKINQTKQTTMYDYANSISYKHKQFYSSLDNTTTTKIISKGQKRLATEHEPSSSMVKKSKATVHDDLPSDLVDQLLRYLDERSRNLAEEEPLKPTSHTSKATCQ